MKEKRYYNGLYIAEIKKTELKEKLRNSDDWNRTLQLIAMDKIENLDSSEDFADSVKGWNQYNPHAEIEQFTSYSGIIYYRIELTTNESFVKDEDGICDNLEIESVADFSEESLDCLRQELE